MLRLMENYARHPFKKPRGTILTASNQVKDLRRNQLVH